MLLDALVVRELALRLVLDVIVACFKDNAVATSPTPVIVMLAAATDATLRALPVVSAACFPAIAVATSPVPVIVTLAAATDATLRALPVVKVACFPFTAAAKVPVIPATVTVEFKKAAPSACSSRVAMTSRA